MASQADLLAARVQAFAVRVLRFVHGLPRDARTDDVLRQLTNAATSTSANYGATRRARSRKEFVAKLGVVAEEADEAEHWLKILSASQFVVGAGSQRELGELLNESTQLRAIFVRSATTARQNLARRE